MRRAGIKPFTLAWWHGIGLGAAMVLSLGILLLSLADPEWVFLTALGFCVWCTRSTYAWLEKVQEQAQRERMKPWNPDPPDDDPS